MDYLDFEIEIATGNGSDYLITVLRSVEGEAQETMHFPFDRQALGNQLLTLLLNSGNTNSQTPSSGVQTIKNFGQSLFNALFIGEVRDRYRASRNEASRQGKGLRLRLHIRPAELMVLPWEFLYDENHGGYLCLSDYTPVVRYLDLPLPPSPLAVTPPLSILGIAVSPKDLADLDIQREMQKIETAVADLKAKGLAKLTWCTGHTWEDLREAMLAGPWHILHFIGHGGFDPIWNEGVIVLEDANGKPFSMTATQLGMLLADHHSLRLVVLNSCGGARGSSHDVFSSTAATLLRRGIPAVVANQYEITDEAAILFSRTFYQMLLDHEMPVDMAISEARKAINMTSLEWGTPVLHMHTPDGVLFEMGPPVSQPLGILETMSSITTTLPTAPLPSSLSELVLAAESTYPPSNGKLILSDPLSQPYFWDTFPTDSDGRSAQFSDGAYHISLSKAPSAFFYTPSIQFANFVFEVQMTILHGSNGGIVFRCDDTGTKYYSIEIGVNGSYALYVNLDATNFKTLVSNSSPVLAMGLNRPNTIAVVANGDVLDLYINHQKLESIQDSTYTNAGYLGLVGEVAVHIADIAFSNAKVWTLVAESCYPPVNSKLVLNDPLSQPYFWDTYSIDSNGISAQFSDGAYHINLTNAPSNSFYPNQIQYSNFAFEVQMTILHGDRGGIVFRCDDTCTKFYLFQIETNGCYSLLVSPDEPSPYQTLASDWSPFIAAALHLPNIIAVVANGSTLDLYVNYQKIESVQDSTFTGRGYLGLKAETDTDAADIAFSNAKVWTW